MSRGIDLVGQTFSRLTVRSFYGVDKFRRCMWVCSCECGKEKIIAGANLRNGTTKSCGCLNTEKKRERFTKHGKSRTKLYKAWRGMIDRCYSPTNKAYQYYGARGITVCDSWRNSFEAFYKDMGDRPKNTTLDRIDSSKGYYPGNCRWAGKAIQARNKNHTGCYWHKGDRKWQASIKNLDGKIVYLGSYTDKTIAHNVYLKAKDTIMKTLKDQEENHAK